MAFKFTIEVKTEGVEEFRHYGPRIWPEIRAGIRIGFERVLKHLLERVRLLTPIFTGALRRSLRFLPIQESKDKVETQLVSDLPYAVKVHEEPYTLGPISKLQPTQPEGRVGNKFVTRTLRYWQETYAEWIAEDAIKHMVRRLGLREKNR